MILKARNKWWRELLTQTRLMKGAKKKKEQKSRYGAPLEEEYEEDNSVILSAIRHGNPDRWISIESDALTREELETLQKIVRGNAELLAKTLVQKIDLIYNLYDEPKGQIIRRLEAMVDAIRAYIGPAPRRWVYIEGEDGQVLPWFVSSARYTKERVVITTNRDGTKDRTVYPPYVTINLTSIERGESDSKSYTWHREDLGNKNIVQLLNEVGIFLETPWMAKKYDDEMVRYHRIIGELGAQYAAVGYGFVKSGSSSYWSSYNYSQIAMVREGYSTKVVIDDNEEDESDESESQSRRGKSKSDGADNTFWRNYDLSLLGKKIKDPEDEDDDEELYGDEDEPAAAEVNPEEAALEKKVSPPLHPYVRVFDLDKHNYLTIHSAFLEDYPWDATLIDKLILPAQTKELIQILVSGTKDSKEDIIRGKMQGVIVIATGEPGTGKTLTAEVFSETIQRPLYTIQCSQLGIDASSIESNLSSILRRAQRWQAILLIDEADVYIRTRGDDIEQNAIVGVFLRVLEYYRGVLFMTSNRETMIDDAIMSRASAWIRYQMPGVDELKDIWKVLSTQYEVPLKGKDIDALIEHLPHLSGRCVRNLLKLARHLAKAKGVTPTADMLRSVAQFQYLPHHSDDELRDAAPKEKR